MSLRLVNRTAEKEAAYAKLLAAEADYETARQEWLATRSLDAARAMDLRGAQVWVRMAEFASAARAEMEVSDGEL